MFLILIVVFFLFADELNERDAGAIRLIKIIGALFLISLVLTMLGVVR